MGTLPALSCWSKGSRGAAHRQLYLVFLALLLFATAEFATADRARARLTDGAISLTWSGVEALRDGRSPLLRGRAIAAISPMEWVLLAPGGARRVPLEATQPTRLVGIDPGLCLLQLVSGAEVLISWELTVSGELTTAVHADLARGQFRSSDIHAQPFGNWETWEAQELRILPGAGSDQLDAVDTHARPGDPNLDGFDLDLSARLRPQALRLDRGLVGAMTPLGMVPSTMRDDRRWLLTRQAPRTRMDIGGSGGTAGRLFGRADFGYHQPSGFGNIDLSGELQYSAFDNTGPAEIATNGLDHNDLEAIETRAIAHVERLGPGSLRLGFYAFGFTRNYFLNAFAVNLPHAPQEDRALLETDAAYDFDLGPGQASIDISYTRDYVETGDGDAFDVFARYARNPSEPETTGDGLAWRGDDPSSAAEDGHLYDYYLRSLGNTLAVRVDTQTDWSNGSTRGHPATREFDPLRLGGELRRTSWRLFEHLAPTQAALGTDSGFQMTQNYGYSRDGDQQDSRSDHEAREPRHLGLFASQRLRLGKTQIEGGLRWERFAPGQRPLRDRSDPLGVDEEITDADLAAEPEHTGVDPRVGLYRPLGHRTHLWIDGGRVRKTPPFEALFYDPSLLEIQAGTALGDDRFGREFIFGNPNLAPEATWRGQVGIHRQLRPDFSVRLSGSMARTPDTWVARTTPVGNDRVSYYENGGDRRESGLHGSARWQTGTHSAIRVSYDLARTETNVIEPAPLYRHLTHPGDPIQNIANPQSPQPYTVWLDDGIDRGYFPSILDRTHRVAAAWILPIAPFGLADDPAAAGQLAITFRAASGLPYTPTFVREDGDVAEALGSGQVIPGTLNQERMPWVWQFDAAVSQAMTVLGQPLRALLEVRNLTHRRNARRIYPATGEPDDDGWLNTPEGQAASESNGESFRGTYLDRIDDPTHYNDGIAGRVGLMVMF